MAAASAATVGSVRLIIGPMFSGKSTELQRLMRRYEVARQTCVLIKYSGDTRYAGSEAAAVTHDAALMPALSLPTLGTAPLWVGERDVIGIDEGQFFPDLVTWCERWANAGKTVLVAALDGTFERKPFGVVAELIPRAEHVKKLNAVCVLCRKDAAFSHRRTAETALEVIGGADKYDALCRVCYRAATE